MRNTKLATMSHRFTVETARCNLKFYSNTFFPCTSCLWNYLTKCNINRYLLFPRILYFFNNLFFLSNVLSDSITLLYFIFDNPLGSQWLYRILGGQMINFFLKMFSYILLLFSFGFSNVCLPKRGRVTNLTCVATCIKILTYWCFLTFSSS